MKTEHREKLIDYLTDNGVQTLIHYPTAPHKQGAYQEWKSESFPISEQIHEQILSLPISPILSDVDVVSVINICNAFKFKK